MHTGKHIKGICNRFPLTKCRILEINMSNIVYSLPSAVNFYGYNSIFMKFDFTQMDRTLKKVLVGVGI